MYSVSTVYRDISLSQYDLLKSLVGALAAAGHHKSINSHLKFQP